MKMGTIGFLLLMGLGMAATFSPEAQGQDTPKKTPSGSAENVIEKGLQSLGIDRDYAIVIADSPDVVERTAAEMLQRFFLQGGLDIVIIPESAAKGPKGFWLGRESDLQPLARWETSGELDVRRIPATEDGFHVKRIGPDIVIAGATPRAVLYGVFAFEDFAREGRNSQVDIRKIPQFASRFMSIPVFLTSDHPEAYREFTEKNAEYFARLGVNGCIDGGGASWELTRFVSSDVFPFQKPPDPALQRRIRTISALCKKYGIDYHMMLWEPLIPRASAGLSLFPPEALGTVQRPWGGDENGQDRTLCVSSPIVQRHYQNLVGKFVRGFPDVKGFLFYNLDGYSWLCTPKLCPRCRAVCTDSPPDTPHPWETQARFTDLLAKAAHEARGDFGFIHWISHFHAEAAEKLVRTSRDYNALAYGVKNGDHDLMIPDVIRPDGSEFLMLQNASAEYASPFYVILGSNTHEVIPNGFQLPFHLYESIRKLRGWGIRHYIGSGAIPYFNQINALAEKEFLWNSDRTPQAFLADLAQRQFGNSAGPLMYAAWEEVRSGMNVWNDLNQQPFSGSQTHVGLGFSYFTNAKAILPDITEFYNNSLTMLINVEPFRVADYQKYKEQAFLDKFQLMGRHLAKAARLAERAITLAEPNKPIGICYYEGIPTPTKKEYAELNYAPLAIADIYCQLRCHMISACRLLEEMERATAEGDRRSAQVKKEQYHALIRQDIAVRQRFIGLLTGFSRMQPCLTRTSLSEEGIAHQIAYMNTEIGKMEQYLAASDW